MLVVCVYLKKPKIHHKYVSATKSVLYYVHGFGNKDMWLCVSGLLGTLVLLSSSRFQPHNLKPIGPFPPNLLILLPPFIYLKFERNCLSNFCVHTDNQCA